MCEHGQRATALHSQSAPASCPVYSSVLTRLCSRLTKSAFSTHSRHATPRSASSCFSCATRMRPRSARSRLTRPAQCLRLPSTKVCQGPAQPRCEALQVKIDGSPACGAIAYVIAALVCALRILRVRGAPHPCRRRTSVAPGHLAGHACVRMPDRRSQGGGVHGAPLLRTAWRTALCALAGAFSAQSLAGKRSGARSVSIPPTHVHARMHSPFRRPVATPRPAAHRPPAKRSSQAPIGAALNCPS